jgi:hypothetical protein
MKNTKLLRIFLFMLGIAFCAFSNANGGQKLLNENFDDKSMTGFSFIAKACNGDGSFANSGPSPQGGYYRRCRVGDWDGGYAEQPFFAYHLNPNINEVYLKFYARLESGFQTNKIRGYKLTMLNNKGTQADQNPPNGGASAYMNVEHGAAMGENAGSGSCHGDSVIEEKNDDHWYGPGLNSYDVGKWVLWEIYIRRNSPGGAYNAHWKIWKTPQGGSKYTVLNKENLQLWDSGCTDLDFESINAGFWHVSPVFNPINVGFIGYIDIDSIEIWDGMPGNNNPDPPKAPNNLRIIE